MNYDLVIENQVAIFVKGTIKLPLHKVWKAWTDAEILMNWWGPVSYSCNYFDIDFTIGGKYLNSLQDSEGKEIWSTGTFKEIIPHKKIVFSDSFSDRNGRIVPASFYHLKGEWALELLVSVEFDELDGKTLIKFTQTGLPNELSVACMKGWQTSFYRLESCLSYLE